MSALESLSEHLAALVEAAGRSVVRVEARGRAPSSGVVWAEGIVIAADHAVEEEDEIEVVLADGRAAAAALAGRDPAVDLAVLKVEATGLTAPAWAGLDALRVGHLVLAVARPGRAVRASLGIVGALGEGWRTSAGGRVDRYVQPDIGLYPGFSGSLLVDAAGRALGMNTSGLARGTALTVPAATLRRTAESLLAKGRMERGFLGIGTQPARLPKPLAAALGRETALLVVTVFPESPAERGGLMLGDVLVGLHGKPVHDIGDLFDLLDEERVGVETTARVLRGGESKELRITIGARP